MADDVDRVTDQQERILAATIAAARGPAGAGALVCEDCDEEIPARRREAYPAARCCVRCQQAREKNDART
jgi:phage/conjugal plasmid C-4 type zinc finger TraR family protein